MVWGIVRNKHRNWNVTRNIERVTATNKTGHIASIHMWIGKMINSNNPTKNNIKWQPWDLDSSLRCLLSSPWWGFLQVGYPNSWMVSRTSQSKNGWFLHSTPISGNHQNVYIYIIYIYMLNKHLPIFLGVTFSDTTHQFFLTHFGFTQQVGGQWHKRGDGEKRCGRSWAPDGVPTGHDGSQNSAPLGVGSF